MCTVRSDLHPTRGVGYKVLVMYKKKLYSRHKYHLWGAIGTPQIAEDKLPGNRSSNVFHLFTTYAQAVQYIAFVRHLLKDHLDKEIAWTPIWPHHRGWMQPSRISQFRIVRVTFDPATAWLGHHAMGVPTLDGRDAIVAPQVTINKVYKARGN